MSWIVCQVREDALQLMAWLLERGRVSAGDRVVAAKPYDFVRLAQLNERGVSFIAKGALQVSPLRVSSVFNLQTGPQTMTVTIRVS